VKRPDSKRAPRRREIFVLTGEEKRTIAFVLIMFLIGLAAAHYRAAHSVAPPKTAVQETAKSAGQPAQNRANSKPRSFAR
jgi:hypothetical protein